MGPIAKRVALPASCLVLAAAGCGSSESDTQKAYIPAQPSAGQDTQATPKSELTVDLKDIRFNPEDVVVRAGGTITWTNKDRVAHTVTYRSGAGRKWNSGDVAPKKRFKRTFDSGDVGLMSYLCTIHANMTGEIRVVK